MGRERTGIGSEHVLDLFWGINETTDLLAHHGILDFVLDGFNMLFKGLHFFRQRTCEHPNHHNKFKVIYAPVGKTYKLTVEANFALRKVARETDPIHLSAMRLEDAEKE